MKRDEKIQLTENGIEKADAVVEVRHLEDLISFPVQAKFFEDMDDFALKALADDIDRNGLKELIEVLPANSVGLPADTILLGHQRRRALLSLGRVEVDVKVRYDLAQASKPTIEAVFLEDNLNRRQMDKLAMARAAKRLLELEHRRKRRSKFVTLFEDAHRDQVGKRVGMSGRNLQRYWNVLKTPREVQDAFSKGQLTLVEAAKIALLSKEEQQQIVDRLLAGKAVKPLVATLQQQRIDDKSDPRSEMPRLLIALSRARRLEKQFPFLAPHYLARVLPKLQEGRQFLSELIEMATLRAQKAGELEKPVLADTLLKKLLESAG